MLSTVFNVMLSASALLSVADAALLPRHASSSPRSLQLQSRDVLGYTYLSCYTEALHSRALSEHSYFDDLMTIEKCATACSGFKYFGVEYGRECYCGNSFNQGSVPAAEAACSFQCPGDATNQCGAGDRLSVYTKTITDTPTGPSGPGPYVAEGCYSEPQNGRALSAKVVAANDMTVAKCASACEGFAYFGLEYYTECYCGNVLKAGSLKLDASRCSFPCAGSAAEQCGGDWALNLYKTEPTTASSSVSSSSSPTPTPNSQYEFDGCYTEAFTGRALFQSAYYDDKMTIAKCEAACSGYSIFGVEYGRECFCGNSLAAGSVSADLAECSFDCPGDATQKCGAGNRLSLFRKTLPQSSSSVSSTISSTVSSSASSSATSSDVSSSESSSATPSSSLTSASSSESSTSSETSSASSSESSSASSSATSTEVSTSESSSATPSSTLTSASSSESSTSSVTSSASSSETSSATSTEVSTSESSSVTSSSTLTSASSSESSTTSTTSSVSSSETSSASSSATSSEASSSESSSSAASTTLASSSFTTSFTPSSSAESSSDPSSSATSTTSSFSTVVSSSTTSIASSSTVPVPSSTTSIASSSTTPGCAATPTFVAVPASCWVSMPAACESLAKVPALPYPENASAATSCRSAFTGQGGPPAAIVSCFNNAGNLPGSTTFKPAIAYACVQSAPVWCAKEAGKCDASGKPIPPPQTNAFADGGFELGAITPPWQPVSTSGGPDLLVTTISNQRFHSGALALRTVFTNASSGNKVWIQYVKLQPGVLYEASWWYYSISATANTAMTMQYVAGGNTFVKTVTTLNGAGGQWIKVTQQFTSVTSIATIYLTIAGTKGVQANTLFIDEFALRPVIV